MKCPICFGKMKAAGIIDVLNPKTNRRHKKQVYRCPKCGYRKL